jgi:very-short-patch-repair endonuclease
MDHKTAITDWLSQHRSTTLPAWLKRHPDTESWIVDQTITYTVKNIMERVYIVLNGPQPQCEYGHARQFNTFERGYRAGCVLGNQCQCVATLRRTQQQKTLQSRYGVDKVGDIPGVAERRQTTSIERYGVPHAMQNSQVRDRLKTTVAQRTPEQRAETLAKTRATTARKYGVGHHMQLASQKQKVRETNLQRYQTSTPLQNPVIAEKMRFTLANRSPEAKDRANNLRRSTMLQRYQVHSASQIPVPAETLQILHDADLFRSAVTGKTREQALAELDVAAHTLYLYAKQHQATDLFVRPLQSQFEIGMAEFLTELGVVYEINNRKLISPLELDFWCPDHRIAIECCGLYWHAERSAGRQRDYHARKHQQCAAQGIQLITVFEDEWRDQRPQVQNRLRYILNHATDSLYARKCEVAEISASESGEFLDQHHLQGRISATQHLGLRHAGELVAVMTFGPARYRTDVTAELLRFCTSQPVTGAASRLFSHYIRQHHPASVCSYSDNRWGSGQVYENLGMTRQSDTVGFYYTDYRHRYNRTRFQKHRLVAQGHDPAKSAWQIMCESGYDRIWDCGQSLWIWRSQ